MPKRGGWKPVQVVWATLDHSELAWAAGFYDGEGSTAFMWQRYDSVKHEWPKVTMSITQVDRRPLDRFRLAVGGVGKVYGPMARRHSPRAQPQHVWQTQSWDTVMFVLAVLWKKLSPPKREQAVTAFTKLRAAWKVAPRQLAR